MQTITVRSGALDGDGIAVVNVLKNGKQVGSGFWDTHASAFWITDEDSGKENVFCSRDTIQNYFGAKA